MTRAHPYKTDNLRALLQTPALQVPVTALPAARHSGDDNALTADSRQFLTAWKAWRGDRLLPRRRDMDLVSVARLMPQMVLLEVFSAERTAFRLAGNDIEQLLGTRLMGRDYLDMISPDLRACRGRLLWQVVNQPVALVTFYGLQQPDGRRREVQVCSVPLLPDEPDTPLQLLAVVSNLPHLYRGESIALTVSGFRVHMIDVGAGLPVIQA